MKIEFKGAVGNNEFKYDYVLEGGSVVNVKPEQEPLVGCISDELDVIKLLKEPKKPKHEFVANRFQENRNIGQAEFFGRY